MKHAFYCIIALCFFVRISYCSEYAQAKKSLSVIIPLINSQKVAFQKERNPREIKRLAMQLSTYAALSKTIIKAVKCRTSLGAALCFMNCPDLADAVCQSLFDNNQLFVSHKHLILIHPLIPLAINATNFSLRLQIMQQLLQSSDAGCFGEITHFFSTINQWQGNRLLLPFAFLHAKSNNNGGMQFIDDIRHINQFFWKDYSFSLIEDESLHPSILDNLDTIHINKTTLPIVEQLMLYKGDSPQKNSLIEYKDHVSKLHEARKKIKKLIQANLQNHAYSNAIKKRLKSALIKMDL